METTFLSAAILIGLTTSLHCVGMCGPIALSLGLNKKQQINFHLQNLTYQLGRVFTYTFLGFLLGIIGQGFELVGFQKYLTVFSGIVLILMALFSFGGSDFVSKLGFLNRFFYKVKINLAQFISKTDYRSRFLTGILNGFLPCGMVYVALTASLAAGGVLESTLFMSVFGIMTIPLMFLMVFLGNVLSIKFRSAVLKIAPVVMFLLGSLFILRGLGFGIPYISPPTESLQVIHNNSQQHHQGNHSSCH